MYGNLHVLLSNLSHPKKVSSAAPAPLSTQASKVPSTFALSKVHASHVGRPTPCPATAAVLYLDTATVKRCEESKVEAQTGAAAVQLETEFV